MEWMAAVLFYSTARTSPPNGESYRPHLVVTGHTAYLGVRFGALNGLAFGQPYTTMLYPLYTGIDYSHLTEGATFQIREGPHTVGEGIVLDASL